MLFAQVDATTQQLLDRVATSQLIMAIATSIVALTVLGAAVLVLPLLLKLRRVTKGVSDDMRPRTPPLLASMTTIASDVSRITTDVRVRVDSLLATLDRIDRTVQQGAAAVEERVQRFGAVLDVVQTEAEELLLDAAATAHGVHETARALREPRPRRAARGPAMHRDRPSDETDRAARLRDADYNEESEVLDERT